MKNISKKKCSLPLCLWNIFLVFCIHHFCCTCMYKCIMLLTLLSLHIIAFIFFSPQVNFGNVGWNFELLFHFRLFCHFVPYSCMLFFSVHCFAKTISSVKPQQNISPYKKPTAPIMSAPNKGQRGPISFSSKSPDLKNKKDDADLSVSSILCLIVPYLGVERILYSVD